MESSALLETFERCLVACLDVCRSLSDQLQEPFIVRAHSFRDLEVVLGCDDVGKKGSLVWIFVMSVICVMCSPERNDFAASRTPSSWEESC